MALCAVLLNNHDKIIHSLLPDRAESTMVEQLLTMLKLFAIATTVLSGSLCDTVPLALSILSFTKFCSNLMGKKVTVRIANRSKIQSDLKTLQRRYPQDVTRSSFS